MKPLSSSARALLDQYREHESLGQTGQDRLLTSIESRIAMGDVPNVPPESVPPVPPEPVTPGVVAKLVSAPLTKVLVGLVVAGAPAAYGIQQFRSDKDGELTKPAAAEVTRRQSQRSEPAGIAEKEATNSQKDRGLSRETSPARPQAPGTADSERDTRTGAARSAGAQSAPAAGATAPRQRRRAEREPAAKPRASDPGESRRFSDRTPRAGSPSAEEGEVATIDEEVALLSAAHASLRAGKPRQALAKLAEHSRRFPESRLADARDAARILALCAAGHREEAKAAAERFLRARPNSPMANRIRSACLTSE